MRLNDRGQALGGIGSGPVTVNGQTILIHGALLQGGGPASWLDRDTILVNSPTLGSWAVIAVPLAHPDDAVVIHPGGANKIVAGGGRYLLWIGPGVGVVGSLGDLPAAGVRGAGLDGTLGYCPNYALGTGLELAAPDGTALYVPGAIVLDDFALQVIGPGQAVWFGNGVVSVEGVAPPVLACPPQKIRRVVTGDGEIWWIYVSGDRGLAQRDGASDGYVLSTGGQFFNFDAIALAGEIHVAWAVQQGEGVGDYRGITIDRSQPRVPLNPPAPIVYPRYAFTHPVIVAPFEAQGSGLPSVYDFGAYYTETPPAIPPTQNRILLAHDGESDWSVPSGLRPYDCVLRECYRVPSETLDQSITRWHRQVGDTLAQWPHDVGVIPMFYDQQRWTVQQILDGLSGLSGVVNLSPRVKLIAPFAYNRANGIVKYPELQHSLADLVAERDRVGIASLTPIPGPVPPDPPKPDPHTWTGAHMDDGTLVAFIGPGGRFLGVENGKIVFNVTEDKTDPRTHFATRAVGDGTYRLEPPSTPGLRLSSDLTQFSGAIQTGLSLSGNDGNYEHFNYEKTVEGVEVFFVQYLTQGVIIGPYLPLTLAVVRV